MKIWTEKLTRALCVMLAGLLAGYQECLASGIWPSDSVLPPEEKSRQGRALEMGEFFWN